MMYVLFSLGTPTEPTGGLPSLDSTSGQYWGQKAFFVKIANRPSSQSSQAARNTTQEVQHKKHHDATHEHRYHDAIVPVQQSSHRVPPKHEDVNRNEDDSLGAILVPLTLPRRPTTINRRESCAAFFRTYL